MNRSTLIAVVAGGLFLLAYAIIYFINMNKINPLYSKCKTEVKIGMSRDSVRNICGKPRFAFSSGPYSHYSYYEKLSSDESFEIRFEGETVIRVEIDPD